jgi:hypothetical protein
LVLKLTALALVIRMLPGTSKLSVIGVAEDTLKIQVVED